MQVRRAGGSLLLLARLVHLAILPPPNSHQPSGQWKQGISLREHLFSLPLWYPASGIAKPVPIPIERLSVWFGAGSLRPVLLRCLLPVR